VGVDSPGTVCDRHGLPDEAVASRHLLMRKNAGKAGKLFRNWCARVQAMRGRAEEPLEPMARAARMVDSHLEGILAH